MGSKALIRCAQLALTFMILFQSKGNAMIITIDGPAGTGKSTIAKQLAEELKFTYFDTGAMYRAFTWAVMEAGLHPSDLEPILGLIPSFNFDIRTEKGEKRYFVGNQEVTDAIRSREVTQKVSVVAAIPEVRHGMVEVQRRYAQNTDAVFEGRDLGTVVFPRADLKVFLTASPEVRADRRYQQLLEKSPAEAAKTSLELILAEINERDQRDSSRAVSPLKQAEDAILIDTSDLDIPGVLQEILRHRDRLPV